MFSATLRLFRHRVSGAVLTLLAFAVSGVFAAPALAAPELGITMTHSNPYGAQASLCPSHKAEPTAAEPCGVNPFTEKEAGDTGESFARESGFNAYTITVSNELAVGSTLTCNGGPATATSFEYQWLRNGVQISSASSGPTTATSETYTVKAQDAGKTIQCLVSATETTANAGSAQTSQPLTIAPAPSTPAPTPPATIAAPTAIGLLTVGSTPSGVTLSCAPGTWTSGSSFSYQWYRNGVPLGSEHGAQSAIYTVQTADLATAASFQCAVTDTNAGGAATVFSALKNTTAAPTKIVTATSSLASSGSATSGEVTVEDTLPPGMVIVGEGSVSAPGWHTPKSTEGLCTLQRGKAVNGYGAIACARSDVLASGASYSQISLHVVVEPKSEDPTLNAANPSLNVATVKGGGAAEANTGEEGKTVVTERVPFGIQSTTVQDVNSLKEPFFQAGGHPFELFTEIVLNYTTGTDGRLVPAGGAPKEVQLELPPGFVGNPLNSARCNKPVEDLSTCPPTITEPISTVIGFTQVVVTGTSGNEAEITNGKPVIFPPTFSNRVSSPIYNLKPPYGSPAELGLVVLEGVPFVLEAKLRSDGDYGVTVGDNALAEHPLAFRTTTCANGVINIKPPFGCKPVQPNSKPFLTNQTQCAPTPPAWTVQTNPWTEPTNYQPKTVTTNLITGCNLLQFHPELEFKPSAAPEGTTQADEPTGMTLNLKVPQTNEATVNATPDLKNISMTLPSGLTVSPSAADGLQACSNAQFGLGTEFGPGSKHTEPPKPAACPKASQIGTVEVHSPLLEETLTGQLFVAEPECSPCSDADDESGKLFRLFLQIEDPAAGVIVKLHGTTVANTQTGQLTTTFEQQPQQPFELLSLKLKGGNRATLANPPSCGAAVTTSDITPWSSPETSDATPSSSYNVDFNGAGEACPSALPFAPSFNAGTVGPNATAADKSPSFSLTFSRQDREASLSGVQVFMPPGLVGKIAGLRKCGEAEIHAAERNEGECPPESQIGTAQAGAGPGTDPFYDSGRVYFTGPTTLKSGLHGPFGLAVVTPAVAGPFNLGNVVVRSAININPNTAAITATSDPLPQIIDGVPLRLRTVNVAINKPGFMLNPTNCSEQKVAATLSSAQGASAQVSSRFGLGGCTSLPFKPTFTATTEGHTSKNGGASLNVKVTYPPGAYANIAKTVTELPNALPSRLTTIQKACPDTVFEANPATCPEGSAIGVATARTPLLSNPLTGPAYLVSHGNRAFPDIEIILQGEGVEVILDGATDIKKGITKTSFEALPDSPVETFELNLPEGPHSALAANVNLCENQSALILPTILTGQNGAVIKQNTPIVVTGCPPTVAITKAKLSGNSLLVTVKVSSQGAVKITGRGLKTVSKSLKPGTYQIRVGFTKTGKSLRKHHRTTSLHVSLKVGKQAVAKATTVRL
jgi:hypothetical protein